MLPLWTLSVLSILRLRPMARAPEKWMPIICMNDHWFCCFFCCFLRGNLWRFHHVVSHPTFPTVFLSKLSLRSIPFAVSCSQAAESFDLASVLRGWQVVTNCDKPQIQFPLQTSKNWNTQEKWTRQETTYSINLHHMPQALSKTLRALSPAKLIRNTFGRSSGSHHLSFQPHQGLITITCDAWSSPSSSKIVTSTPHVEHRPTPKIDPFLVLKSI
jgi:hypothetical protein